MRDRLPSPASQLESRGQLTASGGSPLPGRGACDCVPGGADRWCSGTPEPVHFLTYCVVMLTLCDGRLASNKSKPVDINFVRRKQAERRFRQAQPEYDS